MAVFTVRVDGGMGEKMREREKGGWDGMKWDVN